MIIDLKNIVFGYDNILLDQITLNIPSYSFNILLGKSGCGKTSFIKLILGDLDYSGSILYDNNLLNDNIKKNISLLNEEFTFVTNNVYKELYFSLEQNGYAYEIIDEEITKILNEYDLIDIKNNDINELSDSIKQILSFIIINIRKPKVLIIDNGLCFLNKTTKDKLIKKIKNTMTVIYISCDIEDIYYGDNIIILNNKKIVFNDKLDKVYENEKVLNDSNLKLPFIMDLCKKLEFYGLVDKLLDKNELVDYIWK